jgi:peptidyl-prolyl cis-trans isomerase SurA
MLYAVPVPMRSRLPQRPLLSLLAAAALFGSLSVAEPARATVVERVVAVVGERAILLSDLRRRAQPYLLQMQQTVPAGAQRNAAISQLYKALVERMVDEELEQRAAAQAKVVVTDREVEAALGRVAAQNNISVEKLLIEAKRTGMEPGQYREELRRQLLQAKLINVRLQGRIRVTEDDLKSAYRKLVLEERERLPFRVAWVFIPGRGEPKQQRELAERVAAAARTTEFSELARRYSADEATKNQGGVLAATRLEQVPQAMRRALLALDVGESSGVISVGGGYAVLKLLSREESQLPDYESARAELGERVYVEKMNQARRTWLDNLRRQHHVEVRL